MLSGKLYACGGYDGSSFLQTVEVFNPQTNKYARTFAFCPFLTVVVLGGVM